MQDILGQAILDYFQYQKPSKLWIHNKFGRKEEMPVEIYFRGETDMPDLELIALKNCRGKVLDIGSGAGSHSLILQQQRLDVTAIEISANAAEVMRKRGVDKIVAQDIFSYSGAKFDTLLMLMNGIGLAGSLKGLKLFLQQAKKLVTPNGQLLFDSSDVAYLYKKNAPGGNNYYGEIDYCYEYENQKSDWFQWLYIDQNTMENIATQCGWTMQLVYEDAHDQYLAMLTL